MQKAQSQGGGESWVVSLPHGTRRGGDTAGTVHTSVPAPGDVPLSVCRIRVDVYGGSGTEVKGSVQEGPEPISELLTWHPGVAWGPEGLGVPGVLIAGVFLSVTDAAPVSSGPGVLALKSGEVCGLGLSAEGSDVR